VRVTTENRTPTRGAGLSWLVRAWLIVGLSAFLIAWTTMGLIIGYVYLAWITIMCALIRCVRNVPGFYHSRFQ